MRKIVLSLAAIAALAIGAPAKASLIGAVAGPDSSFSINMAITNFSSADVLELTLDGSTADVGPIVWDSLGTVDGTAGTPGLPPLASAAPVITGVDTSVVTFTFLPGDFSGLGADTLNMLGMDPDFAGDPDSGVTVGELAGVRVTALFAGLGTGTYEFLDDPARGAGLTLAAVPLPAAAPLLAAALAGLGFAGWRKKQKGV